jgi:hypothetical protein
LLRGGMDCALLPPIDSWRVDSKFITSGKG